MSMDSESAPTTGSMSEEADLNYDVLIETQPWKVPEYTAFEQVTDAESAAGFLRSCLEYQGAQSDNESLEGETLSPLDKIMRHMSVIASLSVVREEGEPLQQYYIRRGEKLEPWINAENTLRQQGIS